MTLPARYRYRLRLIGCPTGSSVTRIDVLPEAERRGGQ